MIAGQGKSCEHIKNNLCLFLEHHHETKWLTNTKNKSINLKKKKKIPTKKIKLLRKKENIMFKSKNNCKYMLTQQKNTA